MYMYVFTYSLPHLKRNLSNKKHSVGGETNSTTNLNGGTITDDFWLELPPS